MVDKKNPTNKSGASKKPAPKKVVAKKPAAKKPVAKKPAAKKAPAKKAVPKMNKTVITSEPRESNAVTTHVQHTSSTPELHTEATVVIYANDVASKSLRKRMLSWFKIAK